MFRCNDIFNKTLSSFPIYYSLSSEHTVLSSHQSSSFVLFCTYERFSGIFCAFSNTSVLFHLISTLTCSTYMLPSSCMQEVNSLNKYQVHLCMSKGRATAHVDAFYRNTEQENDYEERVGMDTDRRISDLF
jgi:hypothetical protein